MKTLNIYFISRLLILSALFTCQPSANATKSIILSDQLAEICISRETVSFLEDTSAKLTIKNILQEDGKSITFNASNTPDLLNSNTSSAYWLRFYVTCESDKPFRVEIFDFDIDEISCFIIDSSGYYKENTAGYAYPFDQREIKHKNVSFNLTIPKGQTYCVYMRLFSNGKNVLEPIIRSYDRVLEYGLTEYMLFGVFYGLILLMIFYNLLYFILLRKAHFCYYVLFASGILIYLLSKNGTGFQYLWANLPQLNPYASSIGLFLGVSSMLFFAISYLDLNQNAKRLKHILIGAFIVRSGIFIFQLYNPRDFKWELVDIFYIQIALFAGILQYKYSPNTAKWYIIAYALLDISFLTSGMEHWGLLQSGIFTVYSINIGIILQFIFLSIGIGETVQETYRLKNEAQSRLILEYRKTDELKEKINRELENKVNERTRELADRYIEIKVQQEEIKAMNENLEGLVKKRTFQLEERNKKIKEYSFSNSHLVRGPLARILGLTYLARIENSTDMDQIKLIEENAKDLDEVIKEMTRILEENERVSFFN